MSRYRFRFRSGLTLLELVVVVAVLAILAGFIIPVLNGVAASGRQTAAKASLAAIRDAIMGTPDKPGYFTDTGQLPNTLADLFVEPASVPAYNRDTGRGWRGPYLSNPNGTYPGYSNGFLGPTSPTPYGTPGHPANYGTIGDQAILDSWGHVIILQWPTTGATAAQNQAFVRLVSAGPNGFIDTPQDYSGTPYPPATARGDDIVLFINHADSYP